MTNQKTLKQLQEDLAYYLKEHPGMVEYQRHIETRLKEKYNES